ncbi:MAG: hypothetical protein U0Z26_09585 [Anaerolineales bacterium]
MKFLKRILIPALSLLITCACKVENSTPPMTPTSQPTRPWIQVPLQTPQEVATSQPDTQPVTSDLVWVKEFSNPIFLAIEGHNPNFHDDFTSNFNKGWFYLIDNNTLKPYFAHIQEDNLLLKIPDGLERKDAMTYNPHLARKNLVLSFDFQFGKTQPDDLFRFQYQTNENEAIVLDLFKNEDSQLELNLSNNQTTLQGTYRYFSPEHIHVELLIKGTECAAYINNDPLVYVNECRIEPITQPGQTAVSFHLLSKTGFPATITIDNVRMWDLDLIPHP